MNGRVYDYRLGRFLSVDPIISNPANSQSINPYSYIGNNPLSGVDPTGYEAIQGCTSSTEGDCLGAGFMQSAKFNAAEVTWVNPNVSHDSGESQHASASAKMSPSGAEPQTAQQSNPNPLNAASPPQVGNQIDGINGTAAATSYPIGQRVALGWLVGGLEFRKGIDAFTGEPLSWPQRALSLLGTLSLFLPALSEAIAESRAVVPALAAESRAPSVIQAVESTHQQASAIQAEGTAARAAELRVALPTAQQGRVTMGVGLAEDATGGQRVLVGTSEPRGYLRPGVLLNPGETLAPGFGHAEANVVNFAQQNGLRLLEVGATRPICSSCAALIEGAGARPVTPVKVP